MTGNEIEWSIQCLTEMNLRVNYREEEYLPEEMFVKALSHWSEKLPIKACVQVFAQRFKGKYPARKTIATEFAHKGAENGLQVQTDVIAYKG